MDSSLQPLLDRLDGLSDEFTDIREGVRRALDIADRDPEMALTRARKVLELVIREVFERRCQEPPGTRPLEGLIGRLVKDGFLPARLEAYASTVRMLGNVGTHRFGEAITAADVRLSLSQLEPILAWYFGAERPDAVAARPAGTRQPDSTVGAAGRQQGAGGESPGRASPQESGPPPGQARVLLVEELAFHRRVAAALLGGEGHAVSAASSGPEALAALEREAFDLVLMQVQMDGMDGIEATSRIRRSPNARGLVPIVGMTNDDALRQACLRAGMDGCTSRPPTAVELHESSGPGEFHPQALADPDGRLAPHPALMIQSPV